jgi:hypothetical protein
MPVVRSTPTRTVAGGLLAVLGLSIVGFTAWTLVDAPRMARTLQALADGQHVGFSATDWQAHWRISGFVEGLLGLGVLLAGVGLVRGRLWGLLAWCITTSILLVWMAAMQPFAVYAFEESSVAATLTVAVACVASWLAYWRIARAAHD